MFPPCNYSQKLNVPLLSREKLAVSVLGGRQKMTACHISPCEAKVPAAAPIFVSGERPPRPYPAAPCSLSPNFVPKFVPQFTSRSGPHRAPYSTLERGRLRPYRGTNTPPAFNTLSPNLSLVPPYWPAHTNQTCK